MSQIDLTVGDVWCEGCDRRVPIQVFHGRHKDECPGKQKLVENRRPPAPRQGL